METTLLDWIFNFIGTSGVACIVLAYFLITKGTVDGTSRYYHVLNLSGACLLLISLFWSWNLPSVIIEFFWIAISLYGLWKSRKSSQQPRQP